MQAFECFEFNDSFGLVLELCEGVDLAAHVQQHGHMCEADAREIMAQLLSALKYIHSNQLCHRDVKLENMIYDAKRVVPCLQPGPFRFRGQSSRR